MYDDDEDEAPSWLRIAFELHTKLAQFRDCALRITTVKPCKYPVLDRLLWVKDMAPSTETFSLGPPDFEVPAGWRFAFPVGVNLSHTEIDHLRHIPTSRLLKIQVLKVGEHLSDRKQIAFNPSQAQIVAEFSLI